MLCVVTRWVVDGMNVIGSRADRWWNDPDRAVRRMIEELDAYAAASGDPVVVVFDRRPRDLQAGRHGAVEVAFARRSGRNAADHDIVQLVTDDEAPGSLTVVTSDRRLAERVRDLGAGVVSAGAFGRRIQGEPAARPVKPGRARRR
jgi:predicted RNA-binding protein with PIN domain